MAKVIICPECANEIALEEGRVYQVGEIIECPFCGSELEVTRVNEDGGVEVRLIEEEK